MTDSEAPLEVRHLFAHVLASRDLEISRDCLRLNVSEGLHCNNLGTLFGGISLFSVFTVLSDIASRSEKKIQKIAVRYLRPVSPDSILEVKGTQSGWNGDLRAEGTVGTEHAIVAEAQTVLGVTASYQTQLENLDAHFDSERFDISHRGLSCQIAPIDYSSLAQWFWLLSAIDAAGGLLTSMVPGVVLSATAKLSIEFVRQPAAQRKFHVELEKLKLGRTSMNVQLGIPGIASATATFVNVGCDMKPRALDANP